MQVLAQGHNKQQKLAVGDSSGVIQCFSYKKNDVVVAFKTLPSDEPVTCVTLGRGQGQKDKLFVASEHTIRGFTKKGKEFYRLKTNLTETIQSLVVLDSSIWLTTKFVFLQYVDNKETQFYMSSERINACEVVPVSGVDPVALLGCQDGVVRAMKNSNVLYEVVVGGPVTALKYIADSHDPYRLHALRKELLYGTAGGALGQLLLDVEGARQGFVAIDPEKRGAIKAIFSGVDFTKDGVNDIVVGRDDGHVELWAFDAQLQPSCVFRVRLPEFIHAIDGGFITSPTSQDFVVQTFSGRIVAFAEPAAASPVAGSSKRSLFASLKKGDSGIPEPDAEARLAALQAEVEELRGRLERERAKAGAGVDQLIGVGASFSLKGDFLLDAEDGSHVLTVECGAPIFAVALQADVALELPDSAATPAIVSRSPPDLDNGCLTLATLRCQESTNRVEVRLRVAEGQPGVVQAWVMPQQAPKTCTCLTYPVRPLCLHQRVAALQGDPPMSELRITGSFTLMEMHSWVAFCLPDVPPRPHSPTDATLVFRNCVLGSYLICKYREGEGSFRSDSLSALAVLREAVSREATAQKARVALALEVAPASLAHGVGLLWPRLQAQRGLQRKLRLGEALQELNLQKENRASLTEGLQAILEEAPKLQAMRADAPKQLAYLCGMVKDLYFDWQRFQGLPASKHRIPHLEALLADPKTTAEDVVQFIQEKSQ